MQVVTQSPLAPAPLKPDCFVWYVGDLCDERMQQYNQAIEQRQRQEWRLDVTAPLQRQIADQQGLIVDQQRQIKTLQLKIESQTMDALQNEARNQSLLNGVGAGLGAGIAFLVAVAVFRRLARGTRGPKGEPEGRHLNGNRGMEVIERSSI